MGYQPFGKVKTITLPIDLGLDEGISYQEYKKRYGIDLKDILFLEKDSGGIYLKSNLGLILLNCLNVGVNMGYKSIPAISIITRVSAQNHSSSFDGELNIYGASVTSLDNPTSENGMQGIQFSIDKTKEFNFENLIISGIEY